VAYIGGVFRSATLLERYRALVELDEGVHCGPPIYGPAAGALLEAYRAAGLRPQLTELPEFKA
jgi:nitrate reductase assembly molybdenum cofactor insertion protein NarJ